MERIINVFQIILGLIIAIVFYSVGDIKKLIVLMMIFHFMLGIIFIRRKKLFSIEFIFFLMLSLFIYLRYYIAVFFNYDFAETNYALPVLASREVQLFTIKLTFLNLVGIFFGINYFDSKNLNPMDKEINFGEKSNSYEMIQLGYKLYIFLSIFAIIRLVLNIITVRKVGYAAVYTGVLEQSVPMIIRILSQFQYILFYIILSDFSLKKTQVIVVLLISAIINLPSVFIGGRATIITFLLVSLWVISNRLHIKLRPKWIALFCLMGLVISYFMVVSRTKQYNLIKLLWGESTTIGLTHYLGMFYENAVNKFGKSLRISPLLYSLRGFKYISKIDPLYMVQENSVVLNVVKGSGIGGNYINDMYVMLGSFGVLFFSFVYTILLGTINKFLIKGKSSLLTAIIFFSAMSYAFTSSRQGYFYILDISKILYVIIVYKFLYFLREILKKIDVYYKTS